MFHLSYPRFRGFFAWDELGCLSRSLGFPVDLFKNNLTEEISSEENGLSLQETIKVLDYKLLYKALHMTQNLHTADWNSCVLRRCVAFLDYRALKYEEINNARVAYQAYEAGDMKGMVLSQHVLLRALKMCNKTISPMKLLHRIKHSQRNYDEPGRIQLYEFLDLLLWAGGYKGFVADETFGHFEMEDELFKLTDFDKLLSHHDDRVANQLNAQYLKEEWEFPEVRYKDTKLKEQAVICGDSRVEMTKHQRQTYRYLRSDVGRSQKSVHCAKGGFVRERPVTAPNLSMYSQKDIEEYKRKQSMLAQSAIYHRLQELLKHAYHKNKGKSIEPVDLSDKPVLADYKPSPIPKVVSETELQHTVEHWERLLFDMETEEGRYKIAMDTEMDFFIPKYKERQEEFNQAKSASAPKGRKKKSVSPNRRVNRYEDAVKGLAYPTPRIPPAHSKKCDARFRGWYGVRSKKGPHYILMSPFFHDSPKGQLFRKLAKMSDDEIKNIHGNLIYRKTKKCDIDQRPVTAPAVMTMEEYEEKMRENSGSSKGRNSKQSRASSGYGSMDEDYDKPPPTPTSKRTVDFKTDSVIEDAGELTEEIEYTEQYNVPDKDAVFEVVTDVESDADNISMSKDSVETAISDKIKLMALEKQTPKTGRPRAISAYEARDKQQNSAGENGSMNKQGEPYQRSKSEAGQATMPAVEEVAPMPYMDHSKPKVVSVGSIGKISLLESISEAKFWEDLALEQQRASSKQNTETIEVQSDVDSGAESIGEAIDEVYIEEQIPSQQKSKRKNKGKSNASFEDSDILSLIIEEEKNRKRKQKSFQKSKSKFDCASSKPGSASTVSSRSSRIGSSHSRGSTSSGARSVEPDNSRKIFSPPPATAYNIQAPNSSCETPKTEVKQKRVVVKDITEMRKASVKPPVSKYERLVKRLGDDISPYMRKQMLKSVA